ncbi:MAG: hypothetical protein JSW39_17370 [Desulfobacterales bacterium]|nr:MAG: hypothetical protein JSW39_17370 [Desulfobacterales bacterium]
MPGEPKKQNHPIAAFLIGFIFAVLTLVVFAGVIHHLTISHHGPQLLKPLKDKFFPEHKSPILEEAKRLEEFEIHRHFHHIVEYPQLPESERPVCFICHSDFPHTKNKKVRSLLNMHTQYFVCEACHIKEQTDARIVYKWYNPYDDNPQGPFIGTSYDPETGNLVDVADKFSKLTPFFQKGDELESAIQKQDAPLARDYVKIRDKLTPEQRDGVKNKFHVSIKEKGDDCKLCHAEKGILDFKKLGFADNRIEDLVQLNVKGMLTKYEVFYLPDLFLAPESEKP